MLWERLNMKKKIAVVGHICLDLTPQFPAGPAQALSPGKLIAVGSMTVSTGGCVANTGLALAKLGAPVTLLAKVGGDELGSLILQRVKQAGCEIQLRVGEKESTSYSVVLAQPGRDRIFLHNPGANDTFCANDVPDGVLQSAYLLHFGYPPLMRRFYQNNGEELARLFRRAKRAGVITSLDMAAVDPSSEAGHTDWKSILHRVLPDVDLFVPSIEEVCFMLDRPRFDEWQKRAAGKDVISILTLRDDIVPLAEEILTCGAKVVLLKCGAQGMYLRTADAVRFESSGEYLAKWAGIDRFQSSFRPRRVLSAAGAGDTSVAAFLKAFSDGLPPEVCLACAAAEGACCVEEYDALSGIQPIGELRKRILKWQGVVRGS